MSFASILGKIAPELEAGLSLVGGPFGAIGAMAVKGVAAIVTPGKDNASMADLQAALAGATPDQLLALQKLNDEFKFKTQELKIDVLRLQQEQEATDAADRASARQSFGAVKFVPQMLMSAFFIGAYCFIEYMVMSGRVSVPDAYMPTFNRITDTLLTIVIMICTFWFGSTHSSQRKDDTLAQAALAE